MANVSAPGSHPNNILTGAMGSMEQYSQKAAQVSEAVANFMADKLATDGINGMRAGAIDSATKVMTSATETAKAYRF